MPESLDPAARLHGLLDHCKRKNGGQRTGAEWASYLEVDEDSVDYIQAVAQMALLPGQVRTAFAGLPDTGGMVPYDFFLEPLPAIESAIYFGVQNQSGQLVHFVGKYSDAQVDRILSASALLKRHAGSPADATDLLDAVASTADELSTLLADDTTLEPDVRALLYTLADALRRTAQTFKMTGAEGVAQERDLLIGRLLANTELRQNVSRHPNVVTVLARLLRGTERAASFYNTTVEAGDGIHGVIQAITAG
ncbi:hypothetical protein [Curtobacterium sp. MCSS17_016]|uniref:hypothetical protein n=1 Tax=Curtobacterium sp. MCSS17_016 TaxID=2175644 RepID=UPI000DA6FF54|nr:hypothetical protein [Curtobacterium sp. MCSS17_016]WIE79078.1 hypothetical protein DEJ19_000525 [Curtobacterium sp. MCSS17_016]